MARLSASLGDVKPFEVLPESVYHARVNTVKATVVENGEEKIYVSKASGNPMMELSWKIDEGAHAGREIRFDNVVYRGLDKNQKPISPFRYINLIESTHTPWECMACHSGLRDVAFTKGKGDDGKEKGKSYCPDCGAEGEVEIESNDLVGKRCLIAVKIEKDNRGQDRNVIKEYAPI